MKAKWKRFMDELSVQLIAVILVVVRVLEILVTYLIKRIGGSSDPATLQDLARVEGWLKKYEEIIETAATTTRDNAKAIQELGKMIEKNSKTVERFEAILLGQGGVLVDVATLKERQAAHIENKEIHGGRK